MDIDETDVDKTVNRDVMYMISDDLQVLPVSIEYAMALVDNLEFGARTKHEERNLNVGEDEVSNLLFVIFIKAVCNVYVNWTSNI